MKRLLLIGSFLALFVTAACGGDDSDKATNTPSTGGATATSATGGTTATSGITPSPGTGGEGNAENGRAIASAQCFTCHTIDGSTLVGPSWKGVYGSTVELEGGTTVTADDAYIRESILEPNAKIVKGFPAAMPTFNGLFTDAQIADITAYIKSLK